MYGASPEAPPCNGNGLDENPNPNSNPVQPVTDAPLTVVKVTSVAPRLGSILLTKPTVRTTSTTTSQDITVLPTSTFPPPVSGGFTNSIVPVTAASPPGPANFQSNTGNQSINSIKSPIALLCMYRLGSMCYHLGIWEDDDKEKPEKKPEAKKNSKDKDEKNVEADSMGEQESRELWVGST